MHFVRSRRSDLGAKNAKQGDLVCLTYSTEYYEDFGKKVRDKKIPYLIKINSVGE
ncbi:hypothetical protein [Moraxella lacunata]|uniref:hypothetical protein n=1 Tax=Moraxella lacunata TaxID=477 RepID=UPI003EE21243